MTQGMKTRTPEWLGMVLAGALLSACGGGEHEGEGSGATASTANSTAGVPAPLVGRFGIGGGCADPFVVGVSAVDGARVDATTPIAGGGADVDTSSERDGILQGRRFRLVPIGSDRLSVTVDGGTVEYRRCGG